MINVFLSGCELILVIGLEGLYIGEAFFFKDDSFIFMFFFSLVGHEREKDYGMFMHEMERLRFKSQRLEIMHAGNFSNLSALVDSRKIR